LRDQPSRNCLTALDSVNDCLTALDSVNVGGVLTPPLVAGEQANSKLPFVSDTLTGAGGMAKCDDVR
jgi:hypothetical protein